MKVICVENNYYSRYYFNFTVGRTYDVFITSSNHIIVDDSGRRIHTTSLMEKGFFITIQQWRDNKLKEIGI